MIGYLIYQMMIGLKQFSERGLYVMDEKIKADMQASASLDRVSGINMGSKFSNHYLVECFDPDGNLKWTAEVDNLVPNVGLDENLDKFLKNLRSLSNLNVTTDEIGRLRHNYLNDVPVQLWGNIIDRYTNPNHNHIPNNGWDLLNTATDLLWHKDKPTVSSYNQNAIIVDGLCQAVA